MSSQPPPQFEVSVFTPEKAEVLTQEIAAQQRQSSLAWVNRRNARLWSGERVALTGRPSER